MTGQLDAMRAQMEKDQTALVTYEARNDVLDADDKTNIYQARLSAINDDFGKAQSERMALQADYQVVQQGGLDAILASRLGQQLQPQRLRLVEDQRVLARDATIYGPRHPIYKQAEEVVAHDQAALDDDAALVRRQVADQYRSAAAREALIAAALQRQKQNFDAFNLRAIQYHALKAAADSSTNLYYNLQQRIQDATVASGLRSEDVAVIRFGAAADEAVGTPPAAGGTAHPIRHHAAGGGGAVLVGLADRTVGGADQVELRFNVRVVGALPEVPHAQMGVGLALMHRLEREVGGEGDRQHLPYLEAVYGIYSALQFAEPGTSKQIAVTSSLPGEGKSTLVSYLAAVAASLAGGRLW